MTPDKMPLRAVRVPDEIWNAAQEKAKAEGQTLSAVIRDDLKAYVKRKPRKGDAR